MTIGRHNGTTKRARSSIFPRISCSSSSTWLARSRGSMSRYLPPPRWMLTFSSNSALEIERKRSPPSLSGVTRQIPRNIQLLLKSPSSPPHVSKVHCDLTSGMTIRGISGKKNDQRHYACEWKLNRKLCDWMLRAFRQMFYSWLMFDDARNEIDLVRLRG